MSETASSAQLLIVEDDEGLRRQYRWVFPELQVTLTGNREEAIAVAKRQAIAVAIVDLGLPPLPDEPTEGFATLAAIREASPHTKVIIATGQGAEFKIELPKAMEHRLQPVEKEIPAKAGAPRVE